MKKAQTIEVPFPEKAFRSYLKTYGVPLEKLTGEQIKSLFMVCIKDFQAGSISLDDLSTISSRLLWNRLMKLDKKCLSTKLGSALYAAGEIAFYSRRANKGPLAKTFLKFLTEVLIFQA